MRICWVACLTMISIQGASQLKFRDSAGEISVIKFDQKGRNLAVGYDQGRIELWAINKQMNHLLWSRDINGSILSFGFLESIHQLMVVYQYKGIAFLDKTTGEISKIFVLDFNEYIRDKPERISRADYLDDKNLLAISGNIEDRVIIMDAERLYKSKPNSRDTIYYINSKKFIRQFPEPDSSALVITTITKNVKDPAIQYDLGSDIENFSSNAEMVTCLKMDPALKYVVAGTKSGKLIKWVLKDDSDRISPEFIIPVVSTRQLTEFKDILGLDCRDSIVMSSCFGSIICGQMQRWDARDMSLLDFKEEADPSTCRNIKMSPNSNFLVTTGDFSYRLWVKKPTGYDPFRGIEYAESVGYGLKTNCVDFFSNDILGIGDKQNVYFYDVPNFSFLYNLKNTESKLKEWQIKKE